MGNLLRKNIYIEQSQEDFLAGLDGLSISEHIRRAIDEYIAKKQEKMTISPSKQKKGVALNGQ